jgi:hypothetical protein
VRVHNAVEGRDTAAGAAERFLAAVAERRLYVSEDIAERGRSAVPARAGSVVVMPVGADVRPPSRAAERQVVSEVDAEGGLFLAGQVERAGERPSSDASAATTHSGADPLGDPGLRARLGEASRAAAAAWPDAAATARRVADLYEEILGRPLSGDVHQRRRGRTPSQPQDAGQSKPGHP